MRIQQSIINEPPFSGVSISSNNNNEKIVRLGIQGVPGTSFYLNDITSQSFIIGFTGIYEINFKQLGIDVTKITIDSSETVIVDIIWE